MKHEFALYVPEIAQAGTEIILDDALIIQRIKIILRLSIGQSCILFDQQHHIRATVVEFGKKTIRCVLSDWRRNDVYSPPITFLLPVLKKEALAETVYSLAEMGAQHIQLVITQKVQRQWIPAEMERLKKIIIAAAEQSKNFAFPDIMQPLPFDKAVALGGAYAAKIFFDAGGAPLASLVSASKAEEYFLLVGPEADLTLEEKTLLKEHHFVVYGLTPTVLRAQQAAALGLGIVRSLLI